MSNEVEREEIVRLNMLTQLIQAKEVELETLRWAKNLAEKGIVVAAGGNPDKDYYIMPDGKLLERN